jgi:hypothetical protein
MTSEEVLIDKAFDLIGKLLGVTDDTSTSVAELMIADFGLEQKTAVNIVAIAFERWMQIYFPE